MKNSFKRVVIDVSVQFDSGVSDQAQPWIPNTLMQSEHGWKGTPEFDLKREMPPDDVCGFVLVQLHDVCRYELFVAEGASMPAIAENDKYVSCIPRLQPEVAILSSKAWHGILACHY